MINFSLFTYRMKHKSQFGFSLIEIMITVSIIAILMSIGIPAYNNYVTRTHRHITQAILLENAQWLERYYATNNTYLGATIPFPVSPKNADGTAVRYNISFVPGSLTTTAYVLQATEANNQISDACDTLTFSNTGLQTPTTAGCWQ
jgi:type IV pilus assembly protein PilE